jgi:hypothetical protein
MKSRLLWALILVVAIAALYCGISRPQVSTLPKRIRDPLADLKPVPVPPPEMPPLAVPELPAITPPPLPPKIRLEPLASQPEVPLQDRATIDFSIGAPVVRVQGKDQEALEAAVKEIAEVEKTMKIPAKE